AAKYSIHKSAHRAGAAARLVIRRLAAPVIGDVLHRRDLRQPQAQRALDALLERDVDHAAAVPAAAETQQHHIVVDDVDETDAAAVGGDLRVDLDLQQPGDAFGQRRVGTWLDALDLRRANRQLAAGRIGLVVDLGAIEVRRARPVDIQDEAVAADFEFAPL